MLDQILNQRVKITRVMNAVAAGTTSQNGTAVDMTGFDGVMFIAGVGTLTATQVTSLKGAQSSDNSSFADLEGTNVGPYTDSDGNKLLVLDIFKPEKQYVRPTVVRGTANAVIDCVIAIQYAAREVPTTHGSTVKSSEAHITPAEGTA